MMRLGAMITVDEARCAHETIGGETTVIDTPTGHLYLLFGSGSALWAAIARTVEPQRLYDEVVARFGQDAAREAQLFIDELVELGLMVQSEGDAGEPFDDWPERFETPSYERFDDIADIMTVDPLHDVDQSKGWPYRRPDLGA